MEGEKIPSLFFFRLLAKMKTSSVVRMKAPHTPPPPASPAANVSSPAPVVDCSPKMKLLFSVPALILDIGYVIKR